MRGRRCVRCACCLTCGRIVTLTHYTLIAGLAWLAVSDVHVADGLGCGHRLGLGCCLWTQVWDWDTYGHRSGIGTLTVDTGLGFGHLLWTQAWDWDTYCGHRPGIGILTGHRPGIGALTVDTGLGLGHLLWTQVFDWDTDCGHRPEIGTLTVDTGLGLGH